MFQGFYNVTSSVLTETRNLNVIANNMANVSTPGYKADTLTFKSFEEEMMYRATNKGHTDAELVGSVGKGVTVDRNYTSFTQGSFDLTNRNLDFALKDTGFFVIQNADGETVYTRDGSFSLDEEGYLTLQGVGRVLGDGAPIQLGMDRIAVDTAGTIYNQDTNEVMGTISVVDFQNYDEQLLKNDHGTFTATGEATASTNPSILQGAVERSNVSAVEEMSAMMVSQRALQSSAQIMSMYDQLMSQIVNKLGPG